MIDKIFNDYIQQEHDSSIHHYKLMGVRENIKIENRTPTENYDMLVLLSDLGLIEKNKENLDIINNFHNQLFKYGIEVGVANGKQMILNALKNNKITTKELMEIDCEKYTTFKFESPFLRSDMFEK